MSHIESKEAPMSNVNLNTFGGWTKDDFSKVKIEIPELKDSISIKEKSSKDDQNETLTEIPIHFTLGEETSETIILDNVSVPFDARKAYGVNFVYVELPGFLRDAFSKALSEKYTNIAINEDHLPNDQEKWWRMVRNVEGNVGIVIEKDDRYFKPFKLRNLFDSKQEGIITSMTLSFTIEINNTKNNDEEEITSNPKLVVHMVKANVKQLACIVSPRDDSTIFKLPREVDVVKDDELKRFVELGN